MKKSFLLFVFTFSAFLVFSQDKIKEIRKTYYEVQKNIEAQKNYDIPNENIQITINQNLCGSGAQTISYNMYFSDEYNEKTETEYHTLNFATSSYNVAVYYFIYEEFLFNKNGDLIFYFIREKSADENSFEIRCYFSDNELIKIITKKVKKDGDNNNPADYILSEESKNKIPVFFESDYENIFYRAKYIKKIFETIY